MSNDGSFKEFVGESGKAELDKAMSDYLDLEWKREISNETKEESAEKEAKILNPKIKKVRNKMTHLKPAKKKRK